MNTTSQDIQTNAKDITSPVNSEPKASKNKSPAQFFTTLAAGGPKENHKARITPKFNGDPADWYIPQQPYQMGIWEYIDYIYQMITDPELRTMVWHHDAQGRMQPRDPAEISMDKLMGRMNEIKSKPDYKPVTDPTHPDHGKNLKEVAKEHGVPVDSSFKEAAINALFHYIRKTESGGNYNIVWNYTGGAPLKPGMKTTGGLDVPTFTDKSIAEVIEWQNKYKAEQTNYQKTHPNHIISSPVGAYQIVGKTLEGLVNDMVKKGEISLDDKFDQDMQDKIARKLLLQLPSTNQLLDGKITIKEALEGIRPTWRGLDNVNAEQIQAKIDQNLGPG